MDIIKVPDGETRESFLNSRTNHLQRQHDLYKFMMEDIHCYDDELQAEIIELEMKMIKVLHKMRTIK